MLLTITYTGLNSLDLGYLLHKNPYRPQMIDFNHGKVYVFYPEASNERTTAAILLDIDPIDLVRGKKGTGGLFDYVNDRPYVSSSFLSVAISKVFGTAMTGRADNHQELSDSALELEAAVTMLPCKGRLSMLNKVFEPLGYEVNYKTSIIDETKNNYTEPTIGKYVDLTLKGKARLRDLLKHLYVLIPVFDRQKHYWVGDDEVEKLFRHGEDWLPNHPEKRFITNRYLKNLKPLVNMAFERLVSFDLNETDDIISDDETAVEIPEKKIDLNTQRLESVIAELKNCMAKNVLDIGCGEGNLLNLLIKEKQFQRLTGTDVSHTALVHAAAKLKLDHSSDYIKERVNLFQSSITYKDSRFKGYDAVCVIEVIEHLDIPRLAAFERVLFEYTKPPVIILTTPNREYNVKYENEVFNANLRHSDHRFEWTRAEFKQWAQTTADKNGYSLRLSEIGDFDEVCGAPTQMGVFTLCE